jgi:hypothetical protein
MASLAANVTQFLQGVETAGNDSARKPGKAGYVGDRESLAAIFAKRLDDVEPAGQRLSADLTRHLAVRPSLR